ncbi:AsnC family transcriptional regulator [Candidatus Woesearchaeota archaeon]|mgnify:CR=1 FL=1|jgi:Lrp/AsnC family transcriptional regulator, leucine-responsive regulatory protein|nr:AsnC family transcriptional regulator [Candidatus Woesearchaeota archaeon]MBT6044653.1 AsnC family transcriptional regulator [Candidatus Woesearchaeota archaeon]
MEIDNIDRKILYALHENARASISSLAKKSNLTRETVRYRINKLQDAGIIKGTIAKINMSFFCEGVGTVLFKLTRSDEKKFKEIIEFLKNHNSINWIAELCGSADIVITLLYKNTKDLAEKISEIVEYMGNNLKDHKLSLYVTEYKFDRKDIIIHNVKQACIRPNISFGEKKKLKIKLDDIDIKIISTLAENCRIKNKEIAKTLSVSEDVVRLRIKRLEKFQVIFGYTAVLDLNKFGLESYYINLKIDKMNKEMISKIRFFAQDNPYVGYCTRIAGEYNLVISLYAKSREHFREMFTNMRTYFGENLTDYEFQLNMQEVKEIFLPPQFLEK